MKKNKRWTQEEEGFLIKLRELGYTYKQISIEIGRSAGSCKVKYNTITNPEYLTNQRAKGRQYYQDNREKILEDKKQYYQDNRDKILERQKQYNEDNREKIKQYREDNKDEIAEYQKQYYQDNKDKVSKQQKQYYQDNKDKITEYNKQYYQTNKQYYKQYYQDNKDKIAEYKRNYYAQNPHKSVRKERYDGEFADIQLCHDFYNHICPITGMKDDLQVHHLINIKDNQEFWQSATDEEKIDNLILIHKDLHMSYHSWLGGNKVKSTSESFWEFVDTVYFNEQANLDLFV